MAEEVRGERFEGREPYREVPPEPKVYYMGDHGPFPGKAPTRSDEDIKRDVDTALFYDEAVSSLGIDVDVKGGEVTLNGTVNSELAKDLAGEDAWKVGGVRGVQNDLKVHATPTPSRAAGQDVIPAKPPEAGYGIPLQPQGQPAQPGQPGQPAPRSGEQAQPAMPAQADQQLQQAQQGTHIPIQVPGEQESRRTHEE